MNEQPLLEATGVAKNYGAVAALRNASLSVAHGEVHALMGANGAGKSTLVKILTGAIRPTAGRILIRGEPSDIRSPAEARKAGLVSVYQEPALIPDLFPSNSRGYRVGWQDSLGIVAKQAIEPNTDIWSGDHCSVYPPLVNGILFANVPLDAPDPYMADIMPTLLEIYGVESPVQLDGVSLWPG